MINDQPEQSKTSAGSGNVKAAIEEKKLKTSIFFHISDPIARWRADHRRPPVKMTVQLLKMLCVVTQVRGAWVRMQAGVCIGMHSFLSRAGCLANEQPCQQIP